MVKNATKKVTLSKKKKTPTKKCKKVEKTPSKEIKPSRVKEIPFSKKEVEEFIDMTMGSITQAAKNVGVPYMTFYNWMLKFDLKAYPDKVKKRVAVMAFDRMKYLALTPQNALNATGDKADTSLVKDILKKWGHLIGFEEPVQKHEVKLSIDPWGDLLDVIDPQRKKDDDIEEPSN